MRSSAPSALSTMIGRATRAEVAAHLEPVEVGQPEVEDHHVGGVGLAAASSAADPVMAGPHVVAPGLEAGREHPTRAVVVDDEDGGVSHRRGA